LLHHDLNKEPGMKNHHIESDDVQSIGDVLMDLSTIPWPTLAIDLDSPLTTTPIFFKVLLKHWPGRIIGCTCNSSRAQATVGRLGLELHELISVETTAEKGKAICRSGAMAIVSTDYDMLRQIPPDRVRLLML
jgi:hypothetical protein